MPDTPAPDDPDEFTAVWAARMSALRGAMTWRPSTEPDPFAVRVIV